MLVNSEAMILLVPVTKTVQFSIETVKSQEFGKPFNCAAWIFSIFALENQLKHCLVHLDLEENYFRVRLIILYLWKIWDEVLSG